MLAVYQKLHPMSEDEMKWKQVMLDESVNTFVVAETEEEKAQRLYTKTMLASDVHGMVGRRARGERGGEVHAERV